MESGIFVSFMKSFKISHFFSPLIKDCEKFLGRDALLRHQHKNVIEKVTDFPDRFRIHTVFGCDDGLSAFLAHFFQDFIQPLLKQITGIGVLNRVALSAYYHLIKVINRIIHTGRSFLIYSKFKISSKYAVFRS